MSLKLHMNRSEASRQISAHLDFDDRIIESPHPSDFGSVATVPLIRLVRVVPRRTRSSAVPGLKRSGRGNNYLKNRCLPPRPGRMALWRGNLYRQILSEKQISIPESGTMYRCLKMSSRGLSLVDAGGCRSKRHCGRRVQGEIDITSRAWSKR